MKIVVAMSGGVDSSVAAALLKKEGQDVIGVTMRLLPCTQNRSISTIGCCGTRAIEDARKVAYLLGIPHYVLNFKDVFEHKIISDFCQEYARGRTPNPCVRCNRYIKFGAFLERAKELSAEAIATGHYARVEPDAAGRYLLKKGADPLKDQSYFLCQLTQSQLKYTQFPIGGFPKDRVRSIAREFNLPVADKPESQEVCFISDNDYPNFVKNYVSQAAAPGPILGGDGHILGTHRGIMHYTVGQRKRLGISATVPLYVTAIEPDRNAVIVSTKDQVYGSELIASDLNWIAIDSPAYPLKVKARIRYRHHEAEATISPVEKDNLYVKFTRPQMAITPGQTIVFYDGDVVIGGGTITRQGG